LDDITATQDIYAVINNGRLLNRKALDGLMAQARERKIELDNLRANTD
jgi:hypothetical protein